MINIHITCDSCGAIGSHGGASADIAIRNAILTDDWQHLMIRYLVKETNDMYANVEIEAREEIRCPDCAIPLKEAT